MSTGPLSSTPSSAPSGITLDQVKAALPAHLKSAASQQMVDDINNITSDPFLAENIRENYITYTSVLTEGKFKTEDYLSAVAYVSYKIMGYNNEDSYARTFPQRYQKLIANNVSKKDIAAYVAGYNKGKLVNLILERSIIPSWVLNQDIYQKAINIQHSLMTDPNVSDKVRQEAANSILTHLKKPEGKDFQINLNTTETSGMKEMLGALTDLAQAQKAAIESGNVKTIEIAGSKLPVVDQDS